MAGLRGKILITGGTGFLGRGIMRVAARDGWNAQFTIISRDEQKQAYCKRMYPNARYVLGDVTEPTQLALAMMGHDTVIHAAAMKYIPEGEFNANECVRVNIDGARCVVDAARAAGVGRVVGISTDKAAQPVNIYGMTKAVMERLFAAASNGYGPTFNTCRYGNVIGSTGSVVPVMQRQWYDRKCVQITDQHMTRFWMSVGDAVATVVHALGDVEPGAVIIPEPRAASMQAIAYAVLGSVGEPMSPPDGDIATDPRIEIVGKRPGEKQHEDLVSHYELFRTVAHGDGYMQLLPPGNENYGVDMDTLSSDKARRIDREVLCEMIHDSEGV